MGITLKKCNIFLSFYPRLGFSLGAVKWGESALVGQYIDRFVFVCLQFQSTERKRFVVKVFSPQAQPSNVEMASVWISFLIFEFSSVFLPLCNSYLDVTQQVAYAGCFTLVCPARPRGHGSGGRRQVVETELPAADFLPCLVTKRQPRRSLLMEGSV